tara:strand:+ start:3213 stop:4748 length:1536 start_codon:yes stop_codon:yes gene_type:complete
MEDYDVVIIGSGIGGLCSGSLLALTGHNVLICEAHSSPGGVAHGFRKNGYCFESGPSLWSGIGDLPTTNPLGQILYLLDEKIEIKKYKSWKVLVPEANFDLEVGHKDFREKIKFLRSEQSLEQWDSFLNAVKPISKIINSTPLLSSSPDNLNIFEFLNITRKFFPNIKSLKQITRGFGHIVDEHLEDPFLRNWVDLLSFLISGMEMHDTNTAAMATLFEEWFNPSAYLEYPIGGSETIVKALINGFKKHNGELLLSSRVNSINFDSNIATGVKLENGLEISSKYVVMNTDLWSSMRLLPEDILKKWKTKPDEIKKCNSFLHLHLGFDATGLNDLPIHTIWVDEWERGITAERNVAVFSIPSVLDPNMAPKGKHVLHGYTPANEPWENWESIKHHSKTYKEIKEKSCSIFFTPLRKIIPDIEERIEVKLLGTPITHKKYTNTYCGSYGPAISADKKLFPGCRTPFKNLFLCGASTFPGIGIPAVAASGAFSAEAIMGKTKYKELISRINIDI